mgnify:FL=1|jgi:peptide deformylase
MSVDPSTLRIQNYPAEILRRKADPIDPTEDVAQVARRMIDLMREADGIGLAAPQVGLPWRLFVCYVPEGQGRSLTEGLPSANAAPEVFINPELSDPEGALEPLEEGCLSLPDITGEVLRPPTITITATDLSGDRFTRRATGLLARCWQHEFDHLDGILILDRMTQMWRTKNRARVRDLEKRAGIR